MPAEAVHLVPAGVPSSRAVLAANMETAVNVVWDARPGPGDEIVVIGGGVVGLARGVPVSGSAGRASDVGRSQPLARRVSRTPWVSSTVPSPRTAATADLVIHASGHPGGLRAALAAAGHEAIVVEASWYGASPVPLPLGEAFHSRRLTIRSSQVGHVPPYRAPRWTRGRRLELALSLLADPRLDVLVTGESGFEELPSRARGARPRAGGYALSSHPLPGSAGRGGRRDPERAATNEGDRTSCTASTSATTS